MNRDTWRNIITRRDPYLTETQILKFLDRKERELIDKGFEIENEEPIVKEPKKQSSKFYAIRLKWKLWDLIKDNPAQKIKKAIVQTYG